jgi:hypothetical protein
MKAIITDAEMVRKSGYGSYRINFEILINGVYYKTSFNTNDSQLWDEEEKTTERLVIAVGGLQGILDTLEL